MSIRINRWVAGFVLYFSCGGAFGLGSSIDVSSIRFLPNGSTYTPVGEKSRKSRSVEGDHLFIEYTLNGNERRLWDDDGLATLFLYHRFITSKVYARELTQDSQLPTPYAPLIRALDKLHQEYRQVANSQPSNDDFQRMYQDVSARIQTIKDGFSRPPQTVAFLQSSGLEDLINDLMSNHEYTVEGGDNGPKRDRIQELIAKGTPASVTDRVVARCRDRVNMNWNDVTSQFDNSNTGNRRSRRSSSPSAR